MGGFFALAASVLLPFHLGGGLGAAIAVGFLVGGVALAIASLSLGGVLRVQGGRLWGFVGATGFVVSGAGLVGDVLGRAIVTAEAVAVAAVAAWWLVVWLGLRRKTLFAGFSFLCAVCAVASLVGQVVWEPPVGAVPARFAYVLWGPWGLWLAAAARKA